MDSPIFSFFDLAGRNVVCLRSDGSGGGYIMVANSKYEVVNGPTDPQCSDEIALTTNTTYLIVLGADDVTDNSSGSFKIWINPTSLGGTAPTATTAGQWLLSFGDSNDNIVLGSEDQTAGGSVLTGVNFDELRVGNSYAAVTPASGSSANDTDADNLPDDWEQGYFGDLGANPGDPASNGINTVMECYIAGLDPTDSAATLTLDSIDPLTWSAATGRTYTIWWSSNLLSGFSALQSNVTIGAYTDAVHNADAQGFYKLEVKIAE
jgi:hypothetical protein